MANGRGLGQVGKSLLADESALWFGAAYPGGIWPRGVGNGYGSLDAVQREAERRRQVEVFARAWINFAGMGKQDVEARRPVGWRRRHGACVGR